MPRLTKHQKMCIAHLKAGREAIRKRKEMLKYFEASSASSINNVEPKVEIKVENACNVDEDEDNPLQGHSFFSSEAEQPSTVSAAGKSSPLEHEQYHCLLCYDKISSSTFGPIVTNAELDFRVMFIMKKMLNVPNDKLEHYLQTFGSPSQWLLLMCKNCEPLIERAMWLEKEITRLENYLKKCQREMVSIVKKSMGQKSLLDTLGMHHSLRVTNETRTFVSTEREPMLAKLEKMKLSKQNRKKKTRINGSKQTKMAKNIFKLEKKDPLEDYDFWNDKNTTPVTPVLNDEHVPADNEMGSESNYRAADANSLSLTSASTSNPHTYPCNSNQLAEEELNSVDFRTYSCKLCPNLKEMRLHSFVMHILFHYRRSYRCSICSTHFSSIKELNHCPINEKRRNEQADVIHICSNETLIETKFIPMKIWSCEHCPEMFDVETERDAHEQVAHDNEKCSERKHECISCMMKFRNLTDWRLHRALTHPEIAEVSCYFCDESFTCKTKEGIDGLFNVNLLKTHVKEHHNTIQCNNRAVLHECDFCGDQYGATTGLWNHIEKVHGLNQNRAYSCSLCFTRVLSKSALKSHYKQVHKAGSSTYMCDSCGYETSRQYLFDKHNLRVHKIQPDNRAVLMCTYDGCTFQCLLPRDWKKHLMKVHNAERKYKCKFCSKGFLTSKHCASHEQIHLNKTLKPFQCEICGNSFAVKNYLYIHMRLSHQNRPFASTHKKKPYRKRVRPNNNNANSIDTVSDGATATSIGNTNSNNATPIIFGKESSQRTVPPVMETVTTNMSSSNPTSAMVDFHD